jgi:hypothetical protein
VPSARRRRELGRAVVVVVRVDRYAGGDEFVNPVENVRRQGDTGAGS